MPEFPTKSQDFLASISYIFSKAYKYEPRSCSISHSTSDSMIYLLYFSTKIIQPNIITKAASIITYVIGHTVMYMCVRRYIEVVYDARGR